jgi:predicted nucleic acid-binding protein
MNAVDTNIWIYCHDGRDPVKQRISLQLIESLSGTIVLPWQVGCEFLAASRKLEPLGFSIEDTWAALEDMIAVATSIVMPKREFWLQSRRLQQSYSLHLWDALLLSSCLDSGVKLLYSEDIAHNQMFDSLKIVNPFI